MKNPHGPQRVATWNTRIPPRNNCYHGNTSQELTTWRVHTLMKIQSAGCLNNLGAYTKCSCSAVGRTRYKCHSGCVCIHRGSYQLLDVLLPQRSTLCFPLPPSYKWSWCIYIDTHLLSAISVTSSRWNMDVCLALFDFSFPKSVPHPYYWRSPGLSVSGWLSQSSTVFFPSFINYVYLCVMKYECMSFLFSSHSFLPLTCSFSQVSL